LSYLREADRIRTCGFSTDESNALPLSYRFSGANDGVRLAVYASAEPKRTSRDSRARTAAKHRFITRALTPRRGANSLAVVTAAISLANTKNKTPLGASLPRAFAVHGRSIVPTSLRYQVRSVCGKVRYSPDDGRVQARRGNRGVAQNCTLWNSSVS